MKNLLLNGRNELIFKLILFVLIEVYFCFVNSFHIKELNEVKINAITQCFLHKLLISIWAFIKDLICQELSCIWLLSKFKQSYVSDTFTPVVCCFIIWFNLVYKVTYPFLLFPSSKPTEIRLACLWLEEDSDYLLEMGLFKVLVVKEYVFLKPIDKIRRPIVRILIKQVLQDIILLSYDRYLKQK